MTPEGEREGGEGIEEVANSVPQPESTRVNRRLWRLRGLAVAFPFLVLGAMELSFRLTSTYPSPPSAQPTIDQLLQTDVEYLGGSVFFPEWDRELQLPKPENTNRVFVLGGSSAEGFGVKAPFSALLEAQLRENSPERTWQVINGGQSAFGSHRVLAILRRALQFDPDLVVIYLGHNEFLEEVFFEPDGLVARAERWQRKLGKVRVVNFFRSLAPRDLPRFSPKLQRHFGGNTNFPLIRSQEQYEFRLNFLQANIETMIEACRAAEVQLLVIPAVANLLARPGTSLHRDGFGHEREWNDLFGRAMTHIKGGRWSVAIESLQSLKESDDQYAMVRYLLGLALLREGETVAGAGELLAANLYDKHGDRINPELFQAMVKVCQHQSQPLLDLTAEFTGHLAREAQRLLNGQRLLLFSDHCHPAQLGHEIIAAEIMRYLSVQE